MGKGGWRIRSRPGPSGETLAAAATLAAIQLTQGRTNEQAAVLAPFFTTLGDAIALIAAQRAAREGDYSPFRKASASSSRARP